MTISPAGVTADDIADDDDVPTSAGNVAVQGRSPGQLAWRRLTRDKLALVSAIVLAIYLVLAITGPWVLKALGIQRGAQHSELMDATGFPLGGFGGISRAHPFGIEPSLGRDLLGQVLIGMRTSLSIALAVTIATTIIGVVAGITAGYTGGWADGIISRLMDLFLAFPTLLFLIAVIPVLVTKFQPDPNQSGNNIRAALLLILLTVFGWASLSRLMRGQTVVLRDREFVEAAKAMGASSGHIIFKQLLPNLWAPILISVSLNVPTLVTTTAALSFLGVGIQEPIPDLGRTLQNSVSWIQSDPWYFVFPAATIVILVLAFNLLGDSIRDALDPKSFR